MGNQLHVAHSTEIMGALDRRQPLWLGAVMHRLGDRLTLGLEGARRDHFRPAV